MSFRALIYLVRHGETEFNKNEIVQGGLDSPLTEKGILQTQALGSYLFKKGFRPDLWYSSPQGRARQTSEILAEILFPPAEKTGSVQPEIMYDERLREISCGSAEGKHRSELDPELVRTVREDPFRSYSGGESMHDAYLRSLSFRKYFDEYLSSLDAGRNLNVLIVAHGHLNRALAAAFTGMDSAFALTLTMDNTALSVLQGPEMRNHYRIHLWNQTAHLDNI